VYDSVRNCDNENSQRGTNKNLVKNIARENWCEVSNALLQCEKLAPEKKKTLQSIRLFLKNSMIKYLDSYITCAMARLQEGYKRLDSRKSWIFLQLYKKAEIEEKFEKGT